MFERFTDHSIEIVDLARSEARRLGHAEVGLDHFIIALLDERSGVAGQALKEVGFTLEATRQAVKDLHEPALDKPAAATPLSEQAKQVMELCVKAAEKINDRSVGPEHILLAIIDQNDPTIRSILINLNIDAAPLKARTTYLAIEHLTPVSSVRQRVVDFMNSSNLDTPYTEDALTALKIAQDRARLASFPLAGTEHLLIGIVSGNSPVARELLWLKGVNVTLVQEQIKQLIGTMFESVVSDVGYTPMARRVLMQAQFEATRQKQETKVEHILFGLLSEERSMAAQILRNLNINPTQLRLELMVYSRPAKDPYEDLEF